jgi:hypothetical protein
MSGRIEIKKNISKYYKLPVLIKHEEVEYALKSDSVYRHSVDIQILRCWAVPLSIML